MPSLGRQHLEHKHFVWLGQREDGDALTIMNWLEVSLTVNGELAEAVAQLDARHVELEALAEARIARLLARERRLRRRVVDDEDGAVKLRDARLARRIARRAPGDASRPGAPCPRSLTPPCPDARRSACANRPPAPSLSRPGSGRCIAS